MLEKNIKFLRQNLGMTQTQFGELFSLTRSMIDSYERKITKTPIPFIKQLSEHFSVSLDQLMNEDLRSSSSSFNVAKKELSIAELLKAKDDLISSLHQQIELQKTLIEALQKKDSNG